MSVGYQCPNYNVDRGGDFQDNLCHLHYGPCKRGGAPHMSDQYARIRRQKIAQTAFENGVIDRETYEARMRA